MMTEDIKFPQNIPLAPLSTFNIGGKAKLYVKVDSPDKLVGVINLAKNKKQKFKIFAGGSNVVFPDRGLSCLVIQVLGGKIELKGKQIISDTGVLLTDVINKAINLGLSGLESLSGIPGTIGGAVVGNAGAFGHSISEAVTQVQVFAGEKIYWMEERNCQFDYRESIFKKTDLIILKIICQFGKGESQKLKDYSENIIKIREKKYKPGLKCPGSFFKNVLVREVKSESLSLVDQAKIIDGKIPAGFLLEQVGAKGMQVGGVKIADFHGNLFINTGNGTAADVKKLATILKEKIYQKFGIKLEEEIRYL